MMAQFPSKEIAELSYEYRTLGLGFANIGGLLMTSGIPYDSDEGRAICGAISAIMTGVAYATSAEMAASSALPRLRRQPRHMLRVMRNHRRAAYGATRRLREPAPAPVPLDHANCPDPASSRPPRAAWDRAVELGEKHGYRNAQATVIAPTGTIGLVMDCDTTGIEPDFALVKFKKLAGGGYFKIINQRGAGGAAHARLRPTRSPRSSPMRSATARSPGAGVNHETLKAKGFGRADRRARGGLARPSTSSSCSTAGRSARTSAATRSAVTDEQLNDPALRHAAHLGFSKADIEAANVHVCGAMTLEGAPHLKPEHLPVFDCANPCGRSASAICRSRATSA
jgi:ribonucleoside-diphosphate reductase alpha chain